MNNLLFFIFDAATQWQFLFQDPASIGMNTLVDLHHDIMFFLLVILGIVSYLLIIILQEHVVTESELHNTLPATVVHNTFLEVLWTVIPSFILFIIAVPSFSLLYVLEELRVPDVALKVVGHQWYWTYEYHDPALLPVCDTVVEECRMKQSSDLASDDLRLLETEPYLFLPVGCNIRILVTSDDVIHSWAVPSFGIKVDAVPGRLNQVFLYILRDGRFYGQCSEICGINHGFMPIAIQSCDINQFIFSAFNTVDSDITDSTKIDTSGELKFDDVNDE